MMRAAFPPRKPLYWGAMAIRLLIVFLVLAFGALTLDAFVEEGVTLPGVVSLFILVLLGIGVLGSLLQRPRK
ncbi:MAG TPA: hypothetical protein VIC06_13805 [Solirubrobacteraceae bacterium]|jgi:hypothetical protein